MSKRLTKKEIAIQYALGTLSPHAKFLMARRKSTKPEILEHLTHESKSAVGVYNYWKIQIAVAKNPNTPLCVLAYLLIFYDGSIAEAIASNPSASREMLYKLAEPNTAYYRIKIVCNVAANPNTPRSILKNLSKNQWWEIRRRVAENLYTPARILHALSYDSNPQVRAGVAKNPNTPVDVLEDLSRESSIWVQKALRSR